MATLDDVLEKASKLKDNATLNRTSITSFNSTVATIIGDIRNLLGQIEARAGTLVPQLKTESERSVALSAERDNLTTELARVTAESANLQQQLQGAGAETETLKSKIEELAASEQQLRNQLNANGAALTANTTKINTLSTILDELTNIVEGTAQDLTTLPVNELNEFKDRLTAILASMNEIPPSPVQVPTPAPAPAPAPAPTEINYITNADGTFSLADNAQNSTDKQGIISELQRIGYANIRQFGDIKGNLRPPSSSSGQPTDTRGLISKCIEITLNNLGTPPTGKLPVREVVNVMSTYLVDPPGRNQVTVGGKRTRKNNKRRSVTRKQKRGKKNTRKTRTRTKNVKRGGYIAKFKNKSRKN
jgi:predicted  nucleic acid-binding Zn-ribbon protein